MVTAVYASKAQHDVRAAENREPTETMEQHLYAFLGKRYGTRSVVMEWASAIFKAVQKNAALEADVAVFGKILQNTLAESFPAVQDTLRDTVQQLLRTQLEQRHPQRPAAELEALWRARAKCGVPVAECEEVVRYMYNERDSAEVLSRLQASADKRSAELGLMPNTVRYRDLVQSLLSFQVQLTEAFLVDFVRLFREVDADGDGALDGAQLEELVHRLGRGESGFLGEEPDSPLAAARAALAEARAEAAVQCSGLQHATFSECVDLLTALISARWAARGEDRGP